MATTTWFPVGLDGYDVTVPTCEGTTFGQATDKEDNGVGAWGFPVSHYPHAPLCALPMRTSKIAALAASPLPMLTGLAPSLNGFWAVRVYAFDTDRDKLALLADLGPSAASDGTCAPKGQMRGIDMSEGLVNALGLPPEKGVYRVAYRIIGAAEAYKALHKMTKTV